MGQLLLVEITLPSINVKPDIFGSWLGPISFKIILLGSMLVDASVAIGQLVVWIG